MRRVEWSSAGAGVGMGAENGTRASGSGLGMAGGSEEEAGSESGFGMYGRERDSKLWCRSDTEIEERSKGREMEPESTLPPPTVTSAEADELEDDEPASLSLLPLLDDICLLRTETERTTRNRKDDDKTIFARNNLKQFNTADLWLLIFEKCVFI